MKKPLIALFALTLAIVARSQSIDATTFGREISSNDATLWTDNYKAAYGSEQRICFGKAIMNKFLSTSGLESVYIFRGLDEFDKEVLILKAADNGGELIPNSASIYSNRKELKKDLSTTGSFINDELADKMISKFQTTFKNRVPIYLYGKKGFEVVLQQDGAKGIHFVNGLDQNQQEHVIFVGADKNGMLMADGVIWNHGSGIFSVIKKFFAKK